MTSVSIRALEPAEWEEFRDFRLAALQSAPGVFTMSYEEAVAHAPEQWQATIKGAGNQVFGLFDGQRLIGITAVFSDREDPSGGTALLAMSYILPTHRGCRLSRLFYDVRLAWIRARPQFRRVIVSHRKSNEASRLANQRYGFVKVKQVSQTWPDGVTEDEICYELCIA